MPLDADVYIDCGFLHIAETDIEPAARRAFLANVHGRRLPGGRTQ